MSAGKVVLGAAIGIATGAVLGILFAPDKGTVTRRKLGRSGRRYLGVVENTANHYVEAIEETIDSVRETAMGMSDNMKNAVESLAGRDGKSRKG
jgi:gas vesicle protein